MAAGASKNAPNPVLATKAREKNALECAKKSTVFDHTQVVLQVPRVTRGGADGGEGMLKKLVSFMQIRKLREISEETRFNLIAAGLRVTPSVPCLYRAAEDPVFILGSITLMVKCENSTKGAVDFQIMSKDLPRDILTGTNVLTDLDFSLRDDRSVNQVPIMIHNPAGASGKGAAAVYSTTVIPPNIVEREKAVVTNARPCDREYL